MREECFLEFFLVVFITLQNTLYTCNKNPDDERSENAQDNFGKFIN